MNALTSTERLAEVLIEHYAPPAPSRIFVLAHALVEARAAEDAACTVLGAAAGTSGEATAEIAHTAAYRSTELAVLRLARAVPEGPDDILIKAMAALRRFGQPSDADTYLARRAREDILRWNPALLPLMGLRMPEGHA